MMSTLQPLFSEGNVFVISNSQPVFQLLSDLTHGISILIHSGFAVDC